MTNSTDTKHLHGSEYVNKFEDNQSLYRLERLLTHITLNRGDTVLDCGCGNGMLLPLIEEKIETYVGLDFSPQFVERARQKNKSARCHFTFICVDIIEHCKSTPNTYDVAMAMDLSEHVADNEWKSILTAINFSLKKGGKLYLHTPNRDFFLEKMKENNIFLKQFPEHIAVRTKAENVDLVMKGGFSDASTLGLPHYNILRFLHPLSKLPMIGKWFEARILLSAIK